ncbi:MAG: biopolymer transporter ExbD, partial [Bacteroidota bacterium]
SKNKISPTFSLSSMTDVIFLLLIFFMLTSSAVTPSGIPVNQPASKSAEIALQKVGVTITADLEYFVDGEKVADLVALEQRLKIALEDTQKKEGGIILYVDKAVTTEYLIQVAGIAKSLGAKVTVATKPTS